jgi:hypothetical protein
MLQQPARIVNETPNFSSFGAHSHRFRPPASVAKFPLSQ